MAAPSVPAPAAPSPPLDLLPPPISEPLPPTPGLPAAPRLDPAEFAETCALLYSDVYGGLGRLYVGRPVPEMDATRAAKRGKQLAIVLVKLGWTDEEVIAMLSLSTGVVSDFAVLHAIKTEAAAERPKGEKA